MKDHRADLLREIEDFLKATGMGPSYFGKIAGNNSNLVENLRRGGDCRLATADSVRRFMARHRNGEQVRS